MMTINQAEQALDSCEKNITSSFSVMTSAASAMADNVSEAATATKRRKAMLPLILSVIGLFVCLSGEIFLGIVMIIGGIFWSVKARDKASSLESRIKNAADYLSRTIETQNKV